jgi:DNA-binding Lrp family transcriptional regulator
MAKKLPRIDLKDVELRLVAELIKNSRRSDRDLAKLLAVSQPTITRARSRLEKEGVIKECTTIPDYVTLGFQIMSVTFVKLKSPMSEDALKNVGKIAQAMLKENPTPTILAMTGLGCDADRVVIAFHRDYSEYETFSRELRSHPALTVEDVRSFLINLSDKSNFQCLTFSSLADYLLRKKGALLGKD